MATIPECQLCGVYVHHGPVLCERCADTLRVERDKYSAEINRLCKDRLDGWVNSAFDQVAQTLGFKSAKDLRDGIMDLRQSLQDAVTLFECDDECNDPSTDAWAWLQNARDALTYRETD